MASPLTERATPAELADRSQIIEIKDVFDNFPRLVEIVESDISALPPTARTAKWRHHPVEITLRFGWTDARREMAFVQGHVRARMAGRCQRCLEFLDYELDSPLSWLLVPPGVAVTNYADREIWELDEVWLRPVDVVEETLIMALPMAAKHEDRKNCNVIAPNVAARVSSKVRPFATLKSQLQDLK